jgi:hypothetical protein
MQDRAERFELRLGKDEASMLRTLSRDAGLSGADLLRQLLRKHWNEVSAATNRAKMETLVFGSLTEMTGRPGIGCAVAISSAPGERYMPLAHPDVGPQPVVTNVLQAPMLGNIVTQGFTRVLADQEREQVEARFPGQLATWLFSP